jgi:hypothetical protein
MLIFAPLLHDSADVGVAIAARIIHMAGCCHIWVGVAGEEPAMGGLAVAVQTPRDVDPSVTVLEGVSAWLRIKVWLPLERGIATNCRRNHNGHYYYRIALRVQVLLVVWHGARVR